MIEIDASTQFRRNPAVIETEVEGEIVLLHPGDWDYFEFNRTATALWRLLVTPHTLEEIVAVLVAKFDVAPGRCAKDTAPLLKAMVERGLLSAQ